jgi:3-hydroxy-9,10-secoandrosta-1,3,5(10)-triene-9,17-dione monooxygenase reductase component
VEPDTGRFRTVLGHFPTGVTIVTTLEEGRPWGITVNSFTSLSLEPPLVMVALDHRRAITPVVRRTARFAVNVLGAGGEDLSDCFAGAPSAPCRDDFCGAPWRPGASGLPLLVAAIATVECKVTETIRVGDHDLFVGRVVALGNVEGQPLPLVFYRRRYHGLEAAGGRPVRGKEEGT